MLGIVQSTAGRLLTVGALPAAVPKLPAQVAGPQLLRVGAAVGHVPAAPAAEAAHGGVLKVLVKVPGSQICSHQTFTMRRWGLAANTVTAAQKCSFPICAKDLVKYLCHVNPLL